ncbi:MAG TPA: hypothetical protein VJB18_08330 [Burkholderiales bacterium]|nr:hypothetical protein [Burkholderiales bacterium]
MHETRPARLLAGCSVCTVEHGADGDVVHLHAGGTTLRFKRAAFTLMCETLLSALNQVAPEVTVVTRIHGGQAQPSH